MKREEITAASKWRYATKKFDQTAQLNEKDYQTIKEAIRLAPTSYGLQPFKVIEVTSNATREALKEVGFGQAQLTDSSRLLAFAPLNNFGSDLIERYFTLVKEARGVTDDQIGGYKSFMQQVFSTWSEEQKANWSDKQAYIALGFAMQTAALLQIDTCALEGVDMDAATKILGLDDTEYRVTAFLAIGHRAAADGTQQAAKVRVSEDVLFETI
ncbi:MAG: nitroreductase family protein [Bacteroidetes bacterium]|nr:nitroreductase family protein [Bacteroidota bacterium]